MQSKHIKSRFLVLAAAGALSLGAATPASADTFSTTAGPIPLSPVPLNVCAGDRCVKTPKLGNVVLTVEVTPDDPLGVAPTIRPAACPVGQVGTALIVSVARDASVSGSVTGNANGLLFKRPIAPIVLGANRTLVLSACTF